MFAALGFAREALAQSFAPTGSLATARYDHTATLLTSGQRVLVAGGEGSSDAPLGSAELYTPGTPAPALPGWAAPLLAAGLRVAMARSLRIRSLASEAI